MDFLHKLRNIIITTFSRHLKKTLQLLHGGFRAIFPQGQLWLR